MTPREHSKALRHVREAWEDGKEIQYRVDPNIGNDSWHPYIGNCPDFGNTAIQWRFKPTSKLRAWKPEEVPVGAITMTNDDSFEVLQIVGRNGIGCLLAHGCCAYSFEGMLMLRRYSIDGGKTWHPCGVEEAGE